MGVRFYDQAIVNKISRWVKDPNLRILKPEEATRYFEMTLDEKKDKRLTLPLISISRDKTIEILNTNKTSKTFDGYNLVLTDKIAIPLNVIPIQLEYQIDIYTKGMEQADEYMRNFVFNLINYPRIDIELCYHDIHLFHTSNIQLESAIADNSDIKEHLFADQFTRFTLRLTINDAYLFSIPTNVSGSLETEGLRIINNNENDPITVEEIPEIESNDN